MLYIFRLLQSTTASYPLFVQPAPYAGEYGIPGTPGADENPVARKSDAGEPATSIHLPVSPRQMLQVLPAGYPAMLSRMTRALQPVEQQLAEPSPAVSRLIRLPAGWAYFYGRIRRSFPFYLP